MLIIKAKIKLLKTFLLINKYFSSSNFAIQKKNSLEAARLQIQGKKNQQNWVAVNTGILRFLKVHFMLLCFYERPTLAPVFANQKKSKRIFTLTKKGEKQN